HIQGQCGSCWAFATVASIEAANAIKTGQLTRLSEQEMVDCDTQNNGCQGMNVTKSMYSYRSGIFAPSKTDCEQHSMGSHALTFVGYGTENGQPYWLVKNSWGTYWGQAGYFKLARGQNACGAANSVVGPIMRK
ncbi:papain family cysteine protease, partial [Teladorsagia circumcincta]